MLARILERASPVAVTADVPDKAERALPVAPIAGLTVAVPLIVQVPFASPSISPRQDPAPVQEVKALASPSREGLREEIPEKEAEILAGPEMIEDTEEVPFNPEINEPVASKLDASELVPEIRVAILAEPLKEEITELVPEDEAVNSKSPWILAVTAPDPDKAASISELEKLIRVPVAELVPDREALITASPSISDTVVPVPGIDEANAPAPFKLAVTEEVPETFDVSG